MTAALAAPLSTAIAIPSAANPAAADLSGVSEWVVGVMEAVGAPGAGLVVALFVAKKLRKRRERVTV